MLKYLIFFIFIYSILTFPQYDTPRQTAPTIIKPTSKFCEVVLFTKVACDEYGKISKFYLEKPPCSGPWSKVILNVNASVSGY